MCLEARAIDYDVAVASIYNGDDHRPGYASRARSCSGRAATTTSTYDADVTIRFHAGDQGNGDAFDGPLGTLAHAFLPTGRRPDPPGHLGDAGGRWRRVASLAGRGRRPEVWQCARSATCSGSPSGFRSTCTARKPKKRRRSRKARAAAAVGGEENGRPGAGCLHVVSGITGVFFAIQKYGSIGEGEEPVAATELLRLPEIHAGVRYAFAAVESVSTCRRCRYGRFWICSVTALFVIRSSLILVCSLASPVSF